MRRAAAAAVPEFLCFAEKDASDESSVQALLQAFGDVDGTMLLQQASCC